MSDPHVIMDIGTVTTRMGIGGKDVPEEVFPTVIGEVKSEYREQGVASMQQNQTVYVGKMVIDKRTICKMRHPVEMGVPKVDHDLQLIVDHGLKNLSVGSKKLVFVEPAQVSRKLREEIAELMFEEMNMEEVWMCASSALSLFASGRTTGCVLEAGESSAHVVPFLEGHALSRRRWGKSKLTGMNLTHFLSYMLQRSGQSNEGLPDHIMRKIKEEYCYSSLNVEDDKHQAATKPEELKREYTLPDGHVVCLTEERFQCGEVYFKPSIWLSESERPIHSLITKTITSCDEGLQAKLFQNIVASGGVSLMRGFQARLQKEINTWLNGSQEGRELKTRFRFAKAIQLVDTSKKGQASINTNVCIQPWRGGSILSQLSTFESMKITASDVKENGLRVIHKKEMVPACKDG